MPSIYEAFRGSSGVASSLSLFLLSRSNSTWVLWQSSSTWGKAKAQNLTGLSGLCQGTGGTGSWELPFLLRSPLFLLGNERQEVKVCLHAF